MRKSLHLSSEVENSNVAVLVDLALARFHHYLFAGAWVWYLVPLATFLNGMICSDVLGAHAEKELIKEGADCEMATLGLNVVFCSFMLSFFLDSMANVGDPTYMFKGRWI